MKTAISLPDELFKEAELLARRLGRSRSDLYREALARYLALHDAALVTEGWDEVVAELDDVSDDFVAETARRTLERVEW